MLLITGCCRIICLNSLIMAFVWNHPQEKNPNKQTKNTVCKTVLCLDSLIYGETCTNKVPLFCILEYTSHMLTHRRSMVKKTKCFCFSSLKCWEGRKELLVGFEPRPERVHVVLEVDVSATKTSVGRSYSYFALCFVFLSFSPTFLIPPKPASLPLSPSEWMNNSPLSWCRMHECVHVLYVHTVRACTGLCCVLGRG